MLQRSTVSKIQYPQLYISANSKVDIQIHNLPKKQTRQTRTNLGCFGSDGVVESGRQCTVVQANFGVYKLELEQCVEDDGKCDSDLCAEAKHVTEDGSGILFNCTNALAWTFFVKMGPALALALVFAFAERMVWFSSLLLALRMVLEVCLLTIPSSHSHTHPE